MAARSVTVAALQHRPRQAVLVVVLSAVVTAAAVLGPLYARSVEQSVLRNVVAEASPAQRTLVVADASDEPAAPRLLARTVRAAIPPQFGTPVGGAETPVQLAVPGGDEVQARLTSRDGLCAPPDRLRRPVRPRARARCWSADARRPSPVSNRAPR